MLGKNNFKEKLRQMEEQNKKERFSVRKLSIGAVSVLIGFAFMRFGAQSAQADTVTPGSNPVTAEVKNAGDNSTNKTDQPQAEVSADITAKDEQVNPIVKNDESSLTAKTSNENEDSASKLATDKSKDVVTSTEENHTRSTTEQVAKTEAGNGAVANSQAKADEAAKDLTETAAGQVAQDTAKADRKGTVNDENVINAANDLEKQIMDLENPSNGHNLTSAQLQQINKVLLKRQVLLDRYHAAQAEGRASQTFDPSQFAGISGDLSSIITMLPVVPGNGGFDSTQWGTMNVANWTTTVADGHLKITGYTGDRHKIIVPNGADFANAGRNSGNLTTEIDGQTIHDLITTSEDDTILPTIAFSKTGGQKTKLMGTTTKTFSNPNGWNSHSDYGVEMADVTNLDVSGVTDFSEMFGRVSLILGLDDWDVSHGTNFSSMFSSAHIGDLSPLRNWDVSHGTNFSSMFSSARIGNLSPLRNWDVSHGTNFSSMFYFARIGDLSALSNWRATSGTSFRNMFAGNDHLANLNGLNLLNDGSGNNANFEGMFKKDRLSDDGIQGIKDWKVSKATNMQEMFAYNQLFNPTALKSWKVPNPMTHVAYGSIFDQNGTGNWKWELGGAKQTISFDYPPSYAGTATNRKVQELTYSLSSDTAHLDTVTYSDWPDGEYSVYDLGEHFFNTSNSDRYHYLIIGSNGSPFFTPPALTVDGDKDTSDTSFLGAFAPVDIPQIDGYVAVAKDNAGNIVSNNDGTKINKLPITRIGLNDPTLRISGRDLKFEGNFTVTVHYYQVTVDEGQHAYNTSVNAPKYYVAGHDVYLHVNEQPIGVDQIKQIVHTKDDAGNEVTGAIRGWAPVDTSQIGDKTENLTIHYDGIPDRNLTLTVHVVGAETNNLTHVVYGGSVKPDAKDSIRNASTLERYFGTPTYEWHSDSLARTPMTSTDFNVAKNSGDDDNAWIKVTYADGSSEVKGLKLNLIDTSSLTPVTGQVVTHVNAPGINWDNVIEFRYTDSLNRTQTLTLGQVGTASVSGLDLSQPSARRSYQVTIHYSNGLPDGTVNVPVTVIGAEGQNVVFNKKSTNTAPTITDTDENSHTAISNQGDLSQFGASITWKYADGSAVNWTVPTLGSDGNSVAKAAKVTVHYGDGTTQDVNLNLTIQGSAVTDASHYTAAANDSVHYGQDISGDATGLISYDRTPLTSSTLAGHNISSIAWVTTPDTAVTGTASTPGEHDLTNQQIKITFTDGSVLTKTTTVKVFSGYNDTTKSYTVTSGDVPTADQAKAAIANNADLTSDYGARYAWVKNASGDAMDAGYVTSSSDTTKDAWVKITYRDGKTQIVKVNDLTIKTQAEGLNVTEVNGGLNSHAVASGAPDVGDLKSYFTVSDGSADASASVTGATWATAPDWTSAGDKRGTVTLTFADGSRKIYNLNVHLVGANVSSSRDLSTIRNVLPSTMAESEVSNTSALSPYNASYNWYSDRDATIQLATGDVATPTTTPKTIYLGVVYHKADGSADGKQIFAFNLTVNNNSSNYTATESTTSHGITTHIGAPAFSGWSTNDFAPYITVTKNSDGSVVALTDPAIRSVSWQTAPVTDARAFAEQTAVAKITFADDTPTAHDTLTVNIPVHLKGAKAGTPLTVDSGRQPASAAAKDALDNTSVSGIEDTADGYNWTPSYEWVYSDGHSGYTTTGSYDTAYSASHTTEPAYVQVIYHDDATHTSTQVVPVTLSLRSSNAGITAGNATDADHSSITTHVGAPDTDWNNSNVNDYVHLTYSDDTPVDMNTIGRAGNPISSIEWTTKPDTTNANNTAAVITINFADGSAAKTVSVPTTVVSGAGKLVTSTHDIAVSAETGVDHSALDGHGWDMSYEWSNASGNTLSAADQRTLFAGNTDSDTATNPDTGAVTAHAKGAYITIHFTKGGANDGTQTVWVPLRLTSDADSINPGTGVHFNRAHGNTVTTHANATSADPASGQITITDNDGNSVTSWNFAGWATAADGSHDLSGRDLATDLNDSGLGADGTKDVNNVYAKIRLSDGSYIYTPAMNIHVIGAVGQDVVFNHTATDPHADTADINNHTAIKNTHALAQFDATYTWLKSNGTVIDPTEHYFNTRRVDEPVKVRVNYGDGTHQDVDLHLTVRSDADINASNIQGGSVTVNKGTHLDPTHGDNEAQAAITNAGSLTNLSSTRPFTWTTSVDTATVGNKWGKVTVHYADGSESAPVNVIVNVIDSNSEANHYNPIGGEISVDYNQNVASTVEAKDGIRNWNVMPIDARAAWDPSVVIDTTHANSTVIGKVNVTFGDSSSKLVNVVVHVGPDRSSTDPTHQNDNQLYVPEGQDITTDLNDTQHKLGNAQNGIMNADEMPTNNGGTHYAFKNTVDASREGTVPAIVVVTFPDHSKTEVPINVHIISDASRDHTTPLGQNINKHVDDSISAEEGIQNAAHFTGEGVGFSFEGVTDPSTITRTAGTKGENVVLTYRDGSTKIVPILVNVTDNSGSHTPGHAHHDADDYDPIGTTIERHLHEAIGDAKDGIANASALPNDATYTWTDPAAAGHLTDTTGLKSARVTVTYHDGSTDVATVYVHVTSDADRLGRNITGKTITKNVGESVSASEGVSNPDSVSITPVWDSTEDIDASGKTIAAGSYDETIKVTFGDGSSKIVHATLNVNEHRTNADVYSPVGGQIIKHVDDFLDNTDAKDAIDNNNVMPAGTTYVWAAPVDTSSEGIKRGVVTVGFADGSSKNVNVSVKVISYANDPAFAPIGQDVHVDRPSTTPLSGTNRAEDGIQNADELRNVVSTTVPAYTWVTPVDISRADSTNTGIVKVTYKDGSSRNIAVNVIVGHPATGSNVTEAEPEAKVIEAHYGDVFDPAEQNNAKKGIANVGDLPSGVVYSFISPVPVDSTTHKINQTGNIPVIIHITNNSSYDKRVATILHVTSDADNYNPTPRPIVIDPSHPVDPTNPNVPTNPNDPSDPTRPVGPSNPVNPTPGVDPSTVPSGTTVTWPTDPSGNPIVPDTHTPGDHPTDVVLHYPDGSSETVPTNVHVPTPTPSTPGTHPTDADQNDPIGTTIEKDMSTPTHPVSLTDDDAKNAIANSGSLHDVAGYSWDFAPDISTHGLKHGRVKVSYNDHTYDLVDVGVDVKSMADRFNPDPRPVTVDPRDPSHPSDPTNPTPGVDPSTVPSGTTTGWPTDPSGNPVVPDRTPGDHPTTIVVHYPDGSESHIPTINHMPSSVITPVPRPINVTPGEDPSHIIDPNTNGNGATPGVNPSSVPNGSRTELVPGQTIDTQTPGTHPVNIQVRYPDGTTSAPIPTTIVVPSPVSRPINVTPGEDPSHIVDPNINGNGATPGVDPSTVPSGSHTELVPGQTIDTQTPGTHPVNIQVRYPDGTTSAPIPTTIVVPSPEETYAPEETTQPAPTAPETITTHVVFTDHDHEIVSFPITGKEGETIPLAKIKELIKEKMPKGYIVDMNLEKAWKEGKFVISAKQPIYIKIAKAHRQLVLYIDKKGRIVKRVYVVVKNRQKFTKNFVHDLSKKHQPKGYKMTSYRKVAKHLDIFVSGKKTKATDYGKLVLYVGKGGKIIKRANVNETKGRFDKKNAEKHLPKGYKMSNHKHINRHVDVWVNKK